VEKAPDDPLFESARRALCANINMSATLDEATVDNDEITIRGSGVIDTPGCWGIALRLPHAIDLPEPSLE